MIYMFSYFSLTTIHLLLSFFLPGVKAITVSLVPSAFLHAGRSSYCHRKGSVDEHPMLTSSRIGNRLIAQAIVRDKNNYRLLVRGITMSATAQRFNYEQLQDKQQNSSTTEQYRPLVIVLAGPTAVGKSDVAAKLCSPEMASDIASGHYYASTKKNNDSTTTTILYRGHVISADSVQAYRGVDIGANKPTMEEMKCTPHHLVNVVNPPSDPTKAASYNAASWMGDASYVIDKLVGGSLNYINEDIGSDDYIDTDNSNYEIDGINIDDNSALHDRRVSINKALEQSLAKSKNENNERILPVVVGGTMMYLQWLVHGRPDAIRPTEDAIKRAAEVICTFQQDGESNVHVEIETIEGNNSSSDKTREDYNETNIEQEEENASDIAAWKAASTYVSSLGPVFAQRVEKLPGRDWYRLRRLLEVAYTIVSKKETNATKKKGQEAANKSEEEILQQLTEKEVYTGIRSGSLSDLGYDVRCFFLCPTDRMTHFHIVDERCEQMLLRGLLRETANLYASGGLPDDSQVTRAIGYRQTLEYLKRKDARPNDHEAFMSFIDNFATATRQYAKKQMQWYVLFSYLIQIKIYYFFVLKSHSSFLQPFISDQVSSRCGVCIHTSTDGC